MNANALRLYVIVDPEACAGRDPVAVARAAVRGGAGIIQLRDKRDDVPGMLALAREMGRTVREEGGLFVVNDRVDVALATGADGAHVGQRDLPPLEARTLLGGEAVIGLSLKTAGQVDAAPVESLSYGAIGGIFPTASKEQDLPPAGLEGLKELAGRLRARAPALPVVAISGITVENAASVIKAGADGIAVISAVCAAEDPEAAARALREEVNAALASRRREAG